MRLFASLALLSLALAAPAFAQSASSAPTTTDATAVPLKPVAGDKKKDDGIICHRETPTGSHFPVKVCTTAEQRKAERSSVQRAQQTMQGGPSLVPQ
jgi:hypothetical protein